jgi:uncharacterized protein YozE (UPF0346 family)
MRDCFYRTIINYRQPYGNNPQVRFALILTDSIKIFMVY